MQTINIIRIENVSGIGFFTSDSLEKYSFYDSLDKKHRNFPTPFEDLIGMDYNTFHYCRDYVCAFKSLEQLDTWMHKEWLKELITEFNFSIYMLEIDRDVCLHGNFQICFKHSDIIARTNISNLFL